ncbi:MAG: translation factor GTPase family protein, partial [Planctomycetota bacterium]
IRNVGIVAHIDAGKTTVSERMLFHSGVERRFGEVDSGTSVMDWMAEERERGITITAAATTLPWRDGYRLHLIDTPGHVDFTVEVERSLRVLDGAVLVIDAVAGVQAQSETVWRQMRRYDVPCIAFVNKCDRLGADFLAAVSSIESRLGARAIPVQYPLFQDEEGGGPAQLSGVADLVRRCVYRWEKGRVVEQPWPEAEADELGVLREELLELLAEGDEEFLEQFFEADREPDSASILQALRRATIANRLVPCHCGAALRNVGVPALLDAICDLLPHPLEVAPPEGQLLGSEERITCEPHLDAPLTALIFKLWAGEHGDLSYARVYSGTLQPGDSVYVPRHDRTERVARILRMHADHGQSIERALPGDIVALTGLKFAATGDTLCTKRHAVSLEPLEFPEPVITRSVEPESAADRDRLREALQRLEREDPSFRVREDLETGELLMAGMGELHLEVTCHRLRRDFHVRPRVGQPRVAYREALRAAGRGRGLVETVIGGREVFGAVEVEICPDTERHGVGLEWATEAVPSRFREAVHEALAQEAESGPRFGYPMTQGRVRVIGAESREGLGAD